MGWPREANGKTFELARENPHEKDFEKQEINITAT